MPPRIDMVKERYIPIAKALLAITKRSESISFHKPSLDELYDELKKEGFRLSFGGMLFYYSWSRSQGYIPPSICIGKMKHEDIIENLKVKHPEVLKDLEAVII